VLRVADDGIGFDVGTDGGRGLAALQERAKLLGGWCEVSPRASGGTEVLWQARSGPGGREH